MYEYAQLIEHYVEAPPSTVQNKCAFPQRGGLMILLRRHGLLHPSFQNLFSSFLSVKWHPRDQN